ncbi:hypothetical protein [Gynurincola endophyticus]|jgi:general stress protein CsbA|uniref:hypothetical protein n=1 Tax=Gynurincola endophyticus TaxID=2479004 RepID=UPI000F8DF431|nr:hypothetical protein [Gynurincola endophyticus]
MKSVIGFILIIAGIYLGYRGFQIVQNSGSSLEIGNVEIGAKDAKKEQNGYVWVGAGVASLLLGAVILAKRK